MNSVDDTALIPNDDQVTENAAPDRSMGWIRKLIHVAFGLGVVLAFAAIGFIWLGWADAMAQNRTIMTLLVCVSLSTGTLMWFATVGPFRPKTRGIIVGLAIVSMGLFFVVVEVDYVSGDFYPTFRWRWTLRPDEQLAAQHEQASAVEATALPGMTDWLQYLGTNRLGRLQGVHLSSDWTVPPRQVWRRSIGAGLGGIAIAGGRLVTMEQRGAEEWISCYDATTNRLLWKHAEAGRYSGSGIGGIGPRTTPTIDEDRVYTVGATGILNCVTLHAGKPLWRKQIYEDAGAKPKPWGMAGAPLVVGDVVVVNPGGTDGQCLVAYDKRTGDRVWAAGDDWASYSSPMLATLGGRKQILIFAHTGVYGHAVKDGKVLWKIRWPGTEPKVSLPLVVGTNGLFLSTHYDVGAAFYQFEVDEAGDLTPKRLWKSLRFKSKFAHTVEHQGFVYGLDDGRPVCLKLADGQLQWKGPSSDYGHGQLLLVDDLLLFTTEDGDVTLVEASPKAFHELARFKVFDEQTWNSPTLSGRYLFVRNSREMACFELPSK
jgi:outer membrane protein assembly factor BamB